MTVRSATPDAIAEGGALLAAGRLVAFPTETVYGLGGDATNALAVAAIFEAKGRPSFNPLIVHVADLAAAERLGKFTPPARRLAELIWPGALTLVVRKRSDCPVAPIATAGLDTLAIRVPSYPVAHALLAAAGVPVAAPSANRSGHVTATRAGHVAEDLGDRVSLILDGGPTEFGLESTVVDVSGAQPTLLRSGAVTREAIEAVLGASVGAAGDAGAQPRSPGQLASHYAPSVPVRLNAARARAGEALIAFGPVAGTHDGAVLNLSPTGDLREAAANLFAALRDLDRLKPKAIAVMSIPEHGLGVAINDRLRRAAAGR